MTVSAPRRPGHLGDAPQGQRGERVDDVEGGDVDDDAARPVLADLVDEVVLEPDQLGVVEGSVHRCDQGGSLSHDGHQSRSAVHELVPPSFRVTV